MPRPYFEDNDKKIKEIIMVDHAGEYGAQKIYEGQLDYTKNPKSRELIQHMLEQELEHLDYFKQQIKEGKSRPTFLMPLWQILGYVHPFVTIYILFFFRKSYIMYLVMDSTTPKPI